jgi:hypothetical protein
MFLQLQHNLEFGDLNKGSDMAIKGNASLKNETVDSRKACHEAKSLCSNFDLWASTCKTNY